MCKSVTKLYLNHFKIKSNELQLEQNVEKEEKTLNNAKNMKVHRQYYPIFILFSKFKWLLDQNLEGIVY